MRWKHVIAPMLVAGLALFAASATPALAFIDQDDICGSDLRCCVLVDSLDSDVCKLSIEPDDPPFDLPEIVIDDVLR